jgi:hypothetical protein
MTDGGTMRKSLSLDGTSVQEEVHMMEAFRDDPCRRTDAVTSPPRHGDVLAEREAAIRRGEDRFEDWETAKRRMADSLG